ncbi:hypothetical protein GW915_06590 [bacterium]|nr:hypothetical protein [bacterium]
MKIFVAILFTVSFSTLSVFAFESVEVRGYGFARSTGESIACGQAEDLAELDLRRECETKGTGARLTSYQVDPCLCVRSDVGSLMFDCESWSEGLCSVE